MAKLNWTQNPPSSAVQMMNPGCVYLLNKPNGAPKCRWKCIRFKTNQWFISILLVEIGGWRLKLEPIFFKSTSWSRISFFLGRVFFWEKSTTNIKAPIITRLHERDDCWWGLFTQLDHAALQCLNLNVMYVLYIRYIYIHARMYIKNIHAFTVYTYILHPPENYITILASYGNFQYHFSFAKVGVVFSLEGDMLPIASCTMNPWIWRLLATATRQQLSRWCRASSWFVCLGSDFCFVLDTSIKPVGCYGGIFCRYKYYIGYRRIAPFTKVFPYAPCRSFKSTWWFQRCHFHPCVVKMS